MLAFAAVAAVGALSLDICPGDRVALHGLPDHPLPHTCGARVLFGGSCPGCGLTRSFIHLAQGDWHASYRTHRIGWLFALVVLAQFPYRTAALVCGKRHPLGKTAPKLFGHILLFALVANWTIELLLN